MLMYGDYKKKIDFFSPKERKSHYYDYLRGYKDCLNDLKSYAQARSLVKGHHVSSPFEEDRKVADGADDGVINLFSIIEHFYKCGKENVNYGEQNAETEEN